MEYIVFEDGSSDMYKESGLTMNDVYGTEESRIVTSPSANPGRDLCARSWSRTFYSTHLMLSTQ